MKKTLVIIMLFLNISNIFANESFEDATYLFNAGLYEEALQKIKNKNARKFFVAIAYFRNKNYNESLKYLNKVDIVNHNYLENEINYYKSYNHYYLKNHEKALFFHKKIKNDFILDKEKDILFLKISEKIKPEKDMLLKIKNKYKYLKPNRHSDKMLLLLIQNNFLMYYPDDTIKKETKKIIKDILVKNPNKTIKDKIDEILKNFNIKITLTTAEKIQKCSDLVKKHKNLEGNNCFDEFISKIKLKDKKNYCKAHYFYAAALKKRRKHKKALNEFDKIIKYCPKYKHGDKVNYLAGLSSMMRKDYKKAIKYFNVLYKKYPRSKLADDGINYIGFIYSLKKNYKKANEIYLEQIKKFPNGDTTQDAIWKIAYNYYKQKKYKNYIKFYKSMKNIQQTKYYSKGRLEYWLAKTYEKLKETKKAQSIYLDITENYHNNYYAFLAMMKYKGNLPRRDWNGPKREDEKYARFIEYLKSENKLKKLNFFIENGLHEFIIYELNRLDKKDNIYDKYKKQISVFLINAKIYYLPFWNKKLNQKWISYDLNFERNKEYLKKLYPKAFYVYVKKYAESKKISPYLILSIMREESYFNASIESWANAYGLMQIIEPTAKHLARNLKLPYKREFLFNPDYNIKLGSSYLKWSSNYFKNKIYYVIPSYNAGLNAVKRWKKLKYDNKIKAFDMFIEDIPYTETRHYTKRVLNTYFMYNALYENKFIKLK